MLQKSSEIVARLMAMEGLRVEHKSVETASFNLETRVLTLPIFKNEMSKSVYDLLIGHEVGHALETPREGWHNALDTEILEKYPNKGAGFRSFLNVVEDARIERLIKTRYPGLKKQFFQGYTELFNSGFFGKALDNPEKLILIDRINLYYKVGAHTLVTFKEEEKVFLRRIDKATTWEEVVKIASDIYEYCKDELEEMMAHAEELVSDEDGEGLDYYSDDFEESDDPFTDEHRHISSGSDPLDEYRELESITDREFRKNESKLLDPKQSPAHYVELPVLDPLEFIVPYKTLINNLQVKGVENEAASFKSFNDKNSKYINYLVKEFELRKNAGQLAKARTNKTGTLDTTKLFGYKFNEDLFKSLTIVPNGKNHGLILFLDWSGSMMDHLEPAIEQCLVLTQFCRKAKIEFEVFAFVAYRSNDFPTIKTPATMEVKSGGLNMYYSSFMLTQFLSSKMSSVEYRQMAGKLLKLASYKNRCYSNLPLSNTPLNETILVARYFVDMYRKQNKLDIVNTIFVSDGQGGRIGFNEIPARRGAVCYTDPITKKSVYHGDAYCNIEQMKSFVEIIRETTGTNVVGFYIASRPRDYAPLVGDEFSRVKDDLKTNKFSVITHLGFNEFYIIRGGKDLQIHDETLQVEGNISKHRLLTAFRKNQDRKVVNRILLNRFVKLIA